MQSVYNASNVMLKRNVSKQDILCILTLLTKITCKSHFFLQGFHPDLAVDLKLKLIAEKNPR